MKLDEYLENSYKTEIVGNLLSSKGEEVGLGYSFAADRLTLPYGARISLREKKKRISLRVRQRVWKPDILETSYEGKDLEVEEKKSAHGDILLCVIRIKSFLKRKRRIILEVESVFHSSDPFTAKFMSPRKIVLDLGEGFNLTLNSSKSFTQQLLHDRVILKKVEWISKKSRKLLGPYPVKTSLVPEIQETKETYKKLKANTVYAYQSVPVEVLSSGSLEVTLRMAFCKKTSGKTLSSMNAETFFPLAKKRWKKFSDSLPDFDCSDSNLTRLFYYSFYVLESNRVQIDLPHVKMPFTATCKFFYYRQFFWDSPFQSLAWQWANTPEHARNEVAGLPRQQWRSGLIPYYSILFTILPLEHMADKTSWLNSLSVLPIAILEFYKKFGDEGFLKEMYGRFLKYDDWLWNHLDGDRDGLLASRMGLEVWDYNQRWDDVSRGDCLDPWVEAVNMNCLVYLQRKILLEMGKVTGQLDKSTEKKLRKRQKEMRDNFHLFWDEKDCFYYDITHVEHEKIRVKTPAGFYPLLAGLVDREKKEKLLKHLLNPKEFNTPCPIPSTSADHPTYDPAVMWRGPAWPNVNWMIIKALMDSGEKKVACQMLCKFLKSISKSGKLVAEEYYNSQTGKLGTGVGQYGWGTLPIDMLCRLVVGVNPQTGKGLVLDPLDIGLEWFRLSNLKYKGNTLSIEWSGEKGYSLKVNGKERVHRPSLERIKVPQLSF